jgi:hypothetical protein
VAQLQAAVRAQRDGIQFALGACPAAKADAVLMAQWDAFDVVVTAYLDQDPSLLDTASQMDAGQALQGQLSAWQDRIAAKGCGNLPPKPPAPPASGLEQASSLVIHVAELAAVLATGYLLVQLVKKR